MRIYTTLLLSTFCVLLITSCKKEVDASTAMINDAIDTTAKLLYQGNFMNGPYGSVQGVAKVYKAYNGSSFVYLENFHTSNGPDLHVVISKDAMPANYIDLGSIKSTNGNQTYTINTNVNFTQLPYISIHCVAYNHLFGYAMVR